MKFSTAALAGAALLGSALAKSNSDEGTFSVLRFNGKETCKGRMDPIVSPGQRSAHVHSVFGGSNFGIDASGEKLAQSSCTSTKVKADKSAYWTPSVYFHDKEKNTFEAVPVMYANVYYFFEATDDQIVSFPLGMSMVSGDAMTRIAPASGAKQCLDPADGDINAAHWTCPRNDAKNPLSWPAGSDGSMAGIGDSVNLGQGVGFPFHHCDALYSPLRADIHFPSCYNPEAGLTDFRNNMAWPTRQGASTGYRANCPEGYLHVPHIFMEVYWDTDKFKDRWTYNAGEQPFVLSNGDATGFSVHADFMSGWDEKVLQNVIDNCNTGHEGIHTCPGVEVNNDSECKCEGEVFTDEEVNGTIEKLPGNNQLAGWQYGAMKDAPAPPVEEPAAPEPAPEQPEQETEQPEEEADADVPEGYEPPAYGAEQPQEEADADVPEGYEPPSYDAEKPEEEVEVVGESPVEETPVEEKPVEEKPVEEAQEEPTVTEPEPEPEVPEPETTAPPAHPGKGNHGANCQIKTVWETVTVTADGPAPTAAANATSGEAGGFKLAGCFKDDNSRVLTGDVRPNLGAMTNEKCVAHCVAKGFALAATEYAGQCYCGDELVGSEKLDDGECDMPCEGDEKDVCGGSWALSVYSADGEASVKTGQAYKKRHVHAHREMFVKRHGHGHGHMH